MNLFHFCHECRRGFAAIILFLASAAFLLSCDSNPTGKVNDHTVRTELEGTWTGYEIHEITTPAQLEISGNNYSYSIDGNEFYAGTFALDTSVTPHCMDAYVVRSMFTRYVGKRAYSIYQLIGDTLMIAGNEPGNAERPSSFVLTPGNLVFRLVREQRGDTISILVDGPAVPLDLNPSDTMWVSFPAMEGTIYQFIRIGSSKPSMRLIEDTSGWLGSEVYISSYNYTRWTGQATKKYYIRITTDSSYIDTGTVAIMVHAIPAQMSGITGSYLCWSNFRLARMDASTGAVVTLGKSTDFFPILQYGPDGTLYGVCTDLCVINPLADKITVIGNFAFGGKSYIQMGSGAISPEGELYVKPLSSDTIFRADLSTAKLSFVTTCSEYGRFAIQEQNTIYIAYSKLSRFDLSTFIVTSIGSLSRSPQSIAFVGTGQLLGVSYDSLYMIDVTTARTTSLLLLGNSDIDCFVEERPAPPTRAKHRDGNCPHRTMQELIALRQRHIEAQASVQR